MQEKKAGVARYENVDQDYLHQRQLKKSANTLLLWALGVGAVISGDFYGWQFGLAAGGFWGMTIATLLMAALYVCMVFTIAELTAALPHAGGFYSFVRNALGPTGGYICGVTDTIEYVITPAVIVVGISDYLASLVPAVPAYAWWLIAYAIFVGINIRGAELTLQVGLAITVVAVAVLVTFHVGALARGSFEVDKLFNMPALEGHSSRGLPMGWGGVFAALPAAIWFFLGIEQLPLASEETHDVVNSVPKALILGIMTLLVLSLATLFINSGVGGGAVAIAASGAPLRDGFVAVFGDTSAMTTLLTVLALTGMIASFHSIIYAYGRVLFALSRAGYFPRWISLTNRTHTPHFALLLGAVIGLLCAFAIRMSGSGGAVGAALINMAVFGAVISYILVMASYILLRVTRPTLPRPYKSPLGVPGAAAGMILSLLALAATFLDPALRPAVWGVTIFLAVAIAYFFLYSRNRLVAQAPEEEVALVAKAEQELAH
ncbi:MAG: ethanolamine permease [Planctomycetota bacterium]